MKLQTRFLVLGSIVCALFMQVNWFLFKNMSDEINQQWGAQFAEHQVQFDKNRTLSPLIREIVLARHMAKDPAILAMASNDNNTEVKKNGIRALESYRDQFHERSYFAAFSSNGHYYFNNADNEFSNNQLRYSLSAKHKEDRWFYATLASDKDYLINVSNDTHLGAVKVWINVLLKDNKRTLGVVGTGFNLENFLQRTVNTAQPGVHNFFVDSNLAIQLSPDSSLISYASVAKSRTERITVDSIFDNPEDIDRLHHIAKLMKEQPSHEIRTTWISYHGTKHLLGIAYLPEIDWFDLTIMDPKSLPMLHNFTWLPISFGLLFLLAIGTLNYFLRKWVLYPVAKLKVATEQIQHGNFILDPAVSSLGELEDLSRSFKHMSDYIGAYQSELERKVQERTAELHRLTETDPLTDLLNRRGIAGKFEMEVARLARQDGTIGVLLLDLDHFKNINDTYGHDAGDHALCATANVLKFMKRTYDYAARWGGEEFLLLLPSCPERELITVAERIRTHIQAMQINSGQYIFSLTTSIGAYCTRDQLALESIIKKADEALYLAKSSGRNCVQLVHDAADLPVVLPAIRI